MPNRLPLKTREKILTILRQTSTQYTFNYDWSNRSWNRFTCKYNNKQAFTIKVNTETKEVKYKIYNQTLCKQEYIDNCVLLVNTYLYQNRNTLK